MTSPPKIPRGKHQSKCHASILDLYIVFGPKFKTEQCLQSTAEGIPLIAASNNPQACFLIIKLLRLISLELKLEELIVETYSAATDSTLISPISFNPKCGSDGNTNTVEAAAEG